MNAGPIRRVVLQPTGFCNINCAYCYLADRETRTVMSADVVAATAHLLAGSGLVGDALEVRWHAGEPLTAPVAFYRDAHETFRQALGHRTRVWFSVQTNGIPITDEWCELFTADDVTVGVSIDGPPQLHDLHRRTRRGAPTHARVMRGVERLRRHGIPFDVISVITRETLRNTGAYLRFLDELAPRSVGLNPEESEGAHRSDLFSAETFRTDYRAFLTAMHAWQQRSGIPVRRLAAMRGHILHGREAVRNEQTEPMAILSVDTAGNLSTFSPELLSWSDPAFDDYTFGNVLTPGVSLTSWSAGFRHLAEQIARGRALCEAGCGYFRLCGGGSPSNKRAEHGTFVSAETNACHLNTMAVVDVVLAALETEHAA